MEAYHSVVLDEEKCKGCTHCIRRCPTEAIRVKGGKARIDEERCIDCGECIRTCPNHAKYAQADPLEAIQRFRYRVALPAPAFYAQFKFTIPLGKVLNGLLRLGFHEVFEVARGAEILSAEIARFLEKRNLVLPVISSACPAVVRLVEVKFPSLLDNLLPLDSPLGVAAKIARLRALERGYRPEEVGVFFITPCPAKVTEVRQSGEGLGRIDGAISMASIYTRLMNELHLVEDRPELQIAGFRGIGWARSGGEQESLGEGEYMAVDGIHNVISVFEKIEMGELRGVVYCEAQACIGGCVGGVLAVQNPFIAKVNVNHLLKKYSVFRPWKEEEMEAWRKAGVFVRERAYEAKEVLKLDQNFQRAMEKYQQIEKLLELLPGLDCGACGSPTCRALAEDVVQGKAEEVDCPFLLRDNMLELAREIYALASRVPQTMAGKRREDIGGQDSRSRGTP
uniref:4Fe-4S dicluster domain-containing protein n=1 Tax=Candidatus Caldatribacterium californiense TaxID=1454726 RepID=A0A7V3YL64_9BACT